MVPLLLLFVGTGVSSTDVKSIGSEDSSSSNIDDEIILSVLAVGTAIAAVRVAVAVVALLTAKGVEVYTLLILVGVAVLDDENAAVIVL